MQRFTRFRQVLVMAGVASLMLATTVSAGASSISGKYNAADAKLVPSVYKGKTLQVATDATYAPDESMHGSTMVGFDVDLMYASRQDAGYQGEGEQRHLRHHPPRHRRRPVSDRQLVVHGREESREAGQLR